MTTAGGLLDKKNGGQENGSMRDIFLSSIFLSSTSRGQSGTRGFFSSYKTL